MRAAPHLRENRAMKMGSTQNAVRGVAVPSELVILHQRRTSFSAISARKVPPRRARLPPSRSQWSVFICRCSPTTVARAFLPGHLFPTQSREAALNARSIGFSPCRTTRSPPRKGEPLPSADECGRLRLSGCVFLARKPDPERFSSTIHHPPHSATTLTHHTAPASSHATHTTAAPNPTRPMSWPLTDHRPPTTISRSESPTNARTSADRACRRK